MAEKATEAYDRYAVPGAEKDDEVSKPKDEEAPPIDAHDTMLSNPSDSDADESSESKNSDQKKGRYCSVQYLVIYYVLVLLVVGAAVLLPLYFFTNALFERHNSPKTSSSVSEAASSETSGSGTGGSLPEPAPAGNSDLPKSAAPSMTPNPTEGIPVLSSVPVPGESTIRFLSELNYTSGNLGNGTSGTMMDNNMTGMSTEGSLPTSLAPDTESPGTLIDVLASLEIESDAPTPATSVTVPDSPTPNHATAWKPWTLPIPALATSLSAASPTMAPTTDAPSALPTDGPIDATKTPLFSYLVALGTPEETLADEMTPQGKAIRWLLQEDISQISVFRIPQRYALVSLDFVLHDDSGDDHWRDVTEDFCNWQGVTCDSLEDVIGIKWNRQGLTGTMIPEIVHLSKLKTLDLASNNIEGGLDYFWDLEYLTHMYLFENRFSGAIPDRPAPRGLKKVYLGHNQLTGSIPLTLASSDEGPEELEYLILHHNQLSGNLPEGMRLRNLSYMDISHNDFTGPIPLDWLDQLVRLRFLILDHNRFSGNLPSNFAQLGNGRMRLLYINDNEFTGYFPSGWDDYLTTNMDIANNFFSDLDKDICKISVWDKGELVELRTDCDICRCKNLCHTCTG